jgi:hypothetical protein
MFIHSVWNLYGATKYGNNDEAESWASSTRLLVEKSEVPKHLKKHRILVMRF